MHPYVTFVYATLLLYTYIVHTRRVGEICEIKRGAKTTPAPKSHTPTFGKMHHFRKLRRTAENFELNKHENANLKELVNKRKNKFTSKLDERSFFFRFIY